MAGYHWFDSLRIRLLVPLLVAAIAAAFLVAIASASLGNRWAMEVVDERFEGIRATLRRTAFPLTPTVLETLASLTQTELLTLGPGNEVFGTTLSIGPTDRESLRRQLSMATAGGVAGRLITLSDRRYLLYGFEHQGPRGGPPPITRVVVLFDRVAVDAASRRAAVLPLVTGLSTVVLLTTIVLLIVGRMVARITLLQNRVQRVAAGEFDAPVKASSRDEVGRLHRSIDQMAGQLKQLWATVNQQQGEKLLHQIAGGMAHQLRNTLTGSRLAMELHAQHCGSQSSEEIEVAIRQLETAEDYVRRLSLVAGGRTEVDRPMRVTMCLNDLRAGLDPVARHLHVELVWEWQKVPDEMVVEDGPTFSSAISNLVLNAMDAGNRVRVEAVRCDPEAISVEVADNGTGIDPKIAERLFEPFFTTRSEGMGLGLPVVKRAAEHLAGNVTWQRNNGWTQFVFRCRVKAERG